MLWVLLALLAVAAVAAWVLVFQLLRQHGQLLLRFDSLEERLAASGLEGFQVEAGPESIPVGSPIPSFRLPDVSGGAASLEDFRGKRVLLVNWGPSCGFCDAIAPDLARATGKLRKRNTELVLVTYGDPQANRELAQEYGFDCRMLLTDDSHRFEAFSGIGTPAAYLLDEEGRVERGLAFGADQVPELLQEALDGRVRLSTEKSLSESRLEREGLKAGTPAPDFDLPAIDGETVSLADHRGERVLLVFSDPHCGPCNELAPALARLQDDARAAGLQMVMVSRGELEENRQKRDEQGLEFPVAIQRGWRLSKEYGIFATPVAFLVDEHGVIARDVAKGPDEILTLLQTELPALREEAPMEA